jgi:hypothetical protein
MKNILLLAFLAGAIAVEAAPATINHVSQDQPLSKKELKERRKARRQNGPQVYKGSVAEQQRIVTDAQGAEKEDGEGNTRKERKNKKN